MDSSILTLPELLKKLEKYSFQCEAGNLQMCWDWAELKKRISDLTEDNEKLKIAEKEAREGWKAEYTKTEEANSQLGMSLACWESLKDVLVLEYGKEKMESVPPYSYEDLIKQLVVKGQSVPARLENLEKLKLIVKREDNEQNFFESFEWRQLKRYINFLEQEFKKKTEWAEEDIPLQEDKEIQSYHPLEKSGKEDYYRTACLYVEAKRSKYALIDVLNWILVKFSEQKEALQDEIQQHVDDAVYYRNLAILLGAKPEQMVNKFDKHLCEIGIENPEDPENKWASDNYRDAWGFVEKYEEFLKKLQEELNNPKSENIEEKRVQIYRKIQKLLEESK